jgi:hypothetical protein
MNSTFNNLFAIVSVFAGLALSCDQAVAQMITIPNLGTEALSGTDGTYQLSGSVVNLDAYGLPTALNSSLGGSSNSAPTGWAVSGAQGNTWIANVTLSDPAVAYSIAFQNTTASTETFNVTFSVPISPAESFSPANVRATVSGSLLNGGTDPSIDAILTPLLGSTTGGPGTFLQTSTLTFASGGTASTNVDLTPGTVTAPGNGGDVTFSASTPGFNLFNANGPTGTFSQLSVDLSFSLTAGDFASFTGRVDVVPPSDTIVAPEPSSVILSLLGLGAIALGVYRRRLQTV